MKNTRSEKNIDNLGIQLSLMILNDKLYKNKFIDENMRNKLMAEINTDFRGR